MKRTKIILLGLCCLLVLPLSMQAGEKLLQGYTFFELIKAKRLEMQFASDYNNFISDNRHDAENEIKKAISEIIR